MLASLISLVTGLGVPSRFAKPVLAVVGAVLLIGALWGAKALYDHRVIANHEAQQDASNAKADRKADTTAADQRVADQARLTNESEQVQEATNEARSTGADPRAAYYECVRKQQAARRARKPSPDC